MELRKRLRHKGMRQTQNEETKVKDMECNDELSSVNSTSLPLFEYSYSDNEMAVRFIHTKHFPKRKYRRQ